MKKQIASILLALLLVLTSCGQSKPPLTTATPTTTLNQPPTTAAKSKSTLSKSEIKEKVEALIADEYKSSITYEVSVATLRDGSGFWVSVQIPLELDQPESTQYAEDLLQRIIVLELEEIAQIDIITLKKSQIVDRIDWKK